MFKRLISSALICSVIMSGVTGAAASAVYETENIVPDPYANDLVFAEPEAIEFHDGIEYDPNDNVFHISVDQLVRTLSLFNGNTRNFYDILTITEKNAYDMMKMALTADPTVEIVDIDGINDPDALMRAYCALVADHPEYFWLYDFAYGYAEEDGVISELDARFKYCAGQNVNNIKSNYNTLMNKVSAIVSEANSKYTTDYEKIKYFAAYISDNTTYNNNAANYGSPDMSAYANCWNAYGALINGNGVCEAYAEAFKLLCDKAGIPCISVYSYDHEWNAVKLDGSWYYVDVTWIDTDNKATYQYDKWLAVGTDSARKNDNAGGSHTQNPNVILASPFESRFTYPDISTADYKPSYGTETDPDSGEGSGSGGSDTDSGNGSEGGSGSGASGYSGSGSSVNTKNKDIKSAGTTNYKFTAVLVAPEINVSLPSSISAVINPYGVSVATKNGEYDAGVASPVYTIRNNTKTNAIAVDAEACITVPKDKTSGEPTITVCESPDEVRTKSGKALSVYLLASVSENSVADAASESKDLIKANNVQYETGKTLVFADATLNSDNSNNGTLMVIPKANYTESTLKSYYYGHFQISGAVTGSSNWSSSDKVDLNVVFNIVPCQDPQ